MMIEKELIRMGFAFMDGSKLTREFFSNEPTLVQFGVTRREVMRGNLDRICDTLASLTAIGATAKGTLILSFDGWDYDSRGLAEIPEVSQYIKRIVVGFPHIWYFLRTDLTKRPSMGIPMS
jgi:hypothetical protein